MEVITQHRNLGKGIDADITTEIEMNIVTTIITINNFCYFVQELLTDKIKH